MSTINHLSQLWEDVTSQGENHWLQLTFTLVVVHLRTLSHFDLHRDIHSWSLLCLFPVLPFIFLLFLLFLRPSSAPQSSRPSRLIAVDSASKTVMAAGYSHTGLLHLPTRQNEAVLQHRQGNTSLKVEHLRAFFFKSKQLLTLRIFLKAVRWRQLWGASTAADSRNHFFLLFLIEWAPSAVVNTDTIWLHFHIPTPSSVGFVFLTTFGSDFT